MAVRRAGGAEPGEREAEPREEEGAGGAEDGLDARGGARERVASAADEGAREEGADAGGGGEAVRGGNGGGDVEEGVAGTRAWKEYYLHPL